MKRRIVEILIFLILINLVSSIGLGQNEENAQTSSEISLPVSNNQTDILRFRYWMAPLGQIDHWPWGDSKYYPVKAETFEKWINILESRNFQDSQENESGKIDSLFLQATLEETTFINGSGTAHISPAKTSSKPILWEPFSLGYSFPEPLEKDSMFVANFPNGLNYLINPQDKDIRFSWSLNGKKDSLGNIHFDLNFVRTPIIQFVFEIPNYYEPVCPDGIIRLLEKNDQTKKWTLQLGGHYRTRLSLNSVQKESDIQQKIGYRQENQYLFRLTGTEIVSRFIFDSSEIPVDELIIVLDQPLVPISVELGGMNQKDLIQSQTSLWGTTRLRLKLPSELVGSISELQIKSFTSTPLKTNWRLPGIRILSNQLFWKDSISRLTVERPLIATSFENIDSVQISESPQISPAVLTTQSSAQQTETSPSVKTETFSFRYFEPNATVSLRLTEEDTKIRFSSVTESLFNPDEIHAKTHLLLTSNRENSYRIHIPIRADWAIDSVQASQQDQLVWELSEKDEFNIRTLTITLKKPLTPQEPFSVQLMASLLLPQTSYLEESINVFLLCPIDFKAILFGEHFLSIHSESSYQVGLLKKNGQHVNNKTTQALSMTSSALLRDILTPLRQTVLIPLNDQSSGYQVVLEKTTPNYSADINGTISIRNDELTEQWKIKCVPPTGSRVDRLVIAFVDRPLTPELESATTTTQSSSSRFRRFSNDNILSRNASMEQLPSENFSADRSLLSSRSSWSNLSNHLNNGQNSNLSYKDSSFTQDKNDFVRFVSYQNDPSASVVEQENNPLPRSADSLSAETPATLENFGKNDSFIQNPDWNWSIATETNREFQVAPLSKDEYQSFHFPEGTTAWELQLLTSRSVPFEINVSRTSLFQEFKSIPLIFFPETRSQTADIIVESPNLTPVRINSLRLTSFPAEMPKADEYQTIEGTFRYQPEQLLEDSSFPQLVIKRQEGSFSQEKSNIAQFNQSQPVPSNEISPSDSTEPLSSQESFPANLVTGQNSVSENRLNKSEILRNNQKNKAWCWFYRLDSQHGTEGLVRYYATFYIENHGQEDVSFTLSNPIRFSSIHAVWIDGQRATWYPIIKDNQNIMNVFLPERKRFVSICLEYFVKDQPLQTQYSIDLCCPKCNLPTLSGTWGTWIPPEFVGFSNPDSSKGQIKIDSRDQFGISFADWNRLDLWTSLTFQSFFHDFSYSSQDRFRLLTTHFLTELGNQETIQKILKQKQISLNGETETASEGNSSTSNTIGNNLTWGDIFSHKECYKYLFSEDYLAEFSSYQKMFETSPSFLKKKESNNIVSLSNDPINIYIDRFSMSRSQLLPTSEVVGSNNHTLLGKGIGAMENNGLVILCIEPNILCITTSIAIAEYREMLSPLVSDRVWFVSNEHFASHFRQSVRNKPSPRLIPAEYWTEQFSGPINPWSDSFQETRLLSTTPGWNICKTEIDVPNSTIFIINRYHLTAIKGLAFLILLVLTWRGPFANPTSLIFIIGSCAAISNTMNDIFSVPFMFGVSGVFWGAICSFGFYSIRSRNPLRQTSSTSVLSDELVEEFPEESHSGFVSLNKIPKEQLYSEHSLFLMKQNKASETKVKESDNNSDQIDLTNKINLSRLTRVEGKKTQQVELPLESQQPAFTKDSDSRQRQTRSRVPGLDNSQNNFRSLMPSNRIVQEESTEEHLTERQLLSGEHSIFGTELIERTGEGDGLSDSNGKELNEILRDKHSTKESSSSLLSKKNKGNISLKMLIFLVIFLLFYQFLFSWGLVFAKNQNDVNPFHLESDVTESSEKEPYRVFVPIDQDQKPVKDSFVWVEDEFYEQLKTAVGQEQNEADDWQIVKANYEGSINYNSFTKTLSFFHLKVTYQIRLEKGQAIIKLPMMPLASDVNALFDKQPILPIFQENAAQSQTLPSDSSEESAKMPSSENSAIHKDQGNLIFEIENATPGLHSLELLLAMPQFNSLNETVQIVIPRVPDSRLELMIPNDAPQIYVEQNLGVVSRNGSLLIAELGPVDRIVLRKQEEIGKKGQTSIEVEQLFRLRLRPTQTELLAQFRYRITGGKIKKLYIKTDRSFQYSDYCKCDEAEIESVEYDEVQKDLLCITFKNPVSGNLTLLTQYVAHNFSGIGQLRLPTINAVEARIIRSWLGLFETSNVECQKIPESDITTGDFQSVWNTPDELPVAVYNLLQPNLSWFISIRLKPTTFDIFEQLAFVFKTTQTEMTYLAEIQTTQELFRCSFQTDSVFELTSVELSDEKGNKLESPEIFQVSERLYLSFKNPLIGKYQLKIVGKTASSLDQEMALPSFSIDNSQETKKTVSIYRDHSVYLDLVKPATWVSASSVFSEEEAQSTEFSTIDSAYLYLGSYSVPETEKISAAMVIIHYNFPVISGEQRNIVFHGLNHRWELLTQLSFDIENGEMDHFEIELDELCVGSVELNPPISMKETTQEKKRLLILKPSGPVRGHFEIQLRTFISSSNESLKLPKIIFRPLENGDFSNFRTKIMLPIRDIFDPLQWEVNGLELIEKSETPTFSRPTNALSSIVLDKERLIPKIITDISGMTENDYSEYIVNSENYSASIVLGQKNARVLEASNSFYIRNNGKFFASTIMDIAIAKKESSILYIPPDCQVLNFSIDGMNLSMESLGNGRWNIPLNPLRYSCRLEISYTGNISQKTIRQTNSLFPFLNDSFKTINLSFPYFEDISTAQCYWICAFETDETKPVPCLIRQQKIGQGEFLPQERIVVPSSNAEFENGNWKIPIGYREASPILVRIQMEKMDHLLNLLEWEANTFSNQRKDLVRWYSRWFYYWMNCQNDVEMQIYPNRESIVLSEAQKAAIFIAVSEKTGEHSTLLPNNEENNLHITGFSDIIRESSISNWNELKNRHAKLVETLGLNSVYDSILPQKKQTVSSIALWRLNHPANTNYLFGITNENIGQIVVLKPTSQYYQQASRISQILLWGLITIGIVWGWRRKLGFQLFIKNVHFWLFNVGVLLFLFMEPHFVGLLVLFVVLLTKCKPLWKQKIKRS